MIRRIPLTVGLLAVAAFLIPLLGGQLANDSQGLEPGYAPTVRALFRGTEIATLQHAVLALLVVAALVAIMAKRKIVQFPRPAIGAPLLAFFALLIASFFCSAYRWTSLVSLAEWAVYGAALIAAVSGLGKQRGPHSVLVALSLGCGLTALIGALEYAATASRDPTWRIFSTWQNPNALAGMMVIGMTIGVGIACARRDLPSILIGAGSSVLCGFALVLTGSKGGLLALIVGIVVFVAFALARGGRSQRGRVLGRIGAVLAAIVAVSVLVQIGRGGGGLRVANSGATQEQSAGFRLQLWKGALATSRQNSFVVGKGLGAYAFYSAQAGTNTITELAHESWLQLLVEAGLFAPLALIAAILSWLVTISRGARRLSSESNVLRAAVVAAVLATCFHGLIESNFYYFGIGLSLFLLLGVGIQLSADASAPEFVDRPMRTAVAAFSILGAALLVYAGYVAKWDANLRWAIANRQPEVAKEFAEMLQARAPFDGETWYRSAFLALNPEAQRNDLRRAAEITPSPRHFRALARVQVALAKLPEAKDSLESALRYDPNNLSALLQLGKLEIEMNQEDEARATLQRLIAVEQTPYFKIRSLPQIVPTETYEARLLLAEREPDLATKARLLRGAVEGFLPFAEVTLPYAREMSVVGPLNGVDLADAKATVTKAIDAAKRLALIAQQRKDEAGAQWARQAQAKMEGALAQN